MATFPDIRTPDFARYNALWDPITIAQDRAHAAILQNEASAGPLKAALLQNEIDTGTQNLSDRATLRGLAGGLAHQDMGSIGTALSVPVGVPSVNALSEFGKAQLAYGGLPVPPYGAGGGGGPAVNQLTPQASPSDDDERLIDRAGTAEGGNNPAVVNAGGYNGQYQFGAPRLADLKVYTPAPGEIAPGPGGKLVWNGKTEGTFNIPAFPEIKTQADFLGRGSVDPQRAAEAQRAVMHTQVADLRRIISSTPGAENFDPTGLVMVGHLGGPTGMVKFIQSNGAYDPGDNPRAPGGGTHLSDYYRRFSGNPVAAQQAYGHPDGPLPADHPFHVASNAPTNTATDAGPAAAPDDVQKLLAGYRDTLPGAAASTLQGAPAQPPTVAGSAPAQPAAAAPAQPAGMPGQKYGPTLQEWPAGTKPVLDRLGRPYREQGTPEGMMTVQAPDGTMGAVRMPGVPAPLQIEKTPTHIITFDKSTGQEVSRTPIPETGRMVFRDVPGGSQGYINGHPVGEVVPFSGRPEQDKAYQTDIKQAQALTGAAQTAQANAPRLNEMASLAQGLATGPLGEFKAKAQAYLETLGVPVEQASRLTGMSSAAAAQEFIKLSIGASGAAARADLGANNGIEAVRLYQSANPGVALVQDANRRITNMMRVAGQATQDYAQEALQHFGDNESSFLSGRNYVPLTAFNRAWLGQANPQVYAGAMGILNGDPFDKWSEKLTPAEGHRAAQIAARIDPNAMVPGRGGGSAPAKTFLTGR